MSSAKSLEQWNAHHGSPVKETDPRTTCTGLDHDNRVFVLIPRLIATGTWTGYPDLVAWPTSSFISPLTPATTSPLGQARTQKSSHSFGSMPTAATPTVVPSQGSSGREPLNDATATLLPGVIAAITVGALLATALAVSSLWICFKRKRRDRRLDRDTSPSLRRQDMPIRMELISGEDGSPTPRSDFWIEHQEFWDPRDNSSTGIRSPTPRPAVAETRSYTRALQRPRVYDVGKPNTREWQGPGATSGPPPPANPPILVRYAVDTLPYPRTHCSQRASCEGSSSEDHRDVVSPVSSTYSQK